MDTEGRRCPERPVRAEAKPVRPGRPPYVQNARLRVVTMSRRDRGTADSFLDGLCMYRQLVFVVFVVSTIMLLLTLVSYGVVERGTETYVVVVLNMFGLGGFALVSGVVLLLCRDRTS